MGKLKSITIETENRDVYDLTVGDNHNFFANGVLVHNCGEIPLNTYGSCILMCLNLTSFITERFTNKAKFDKSMFSECVEVAVRLIDDLVDLEIEKIDNIIHFISSVDDNDIKKVELNLWKNIKACYLKGRRVGLGITGLGDTLAYLNIKFDSEEAEDMVDNIFKQLHYNSYYYSNKLAEERGPFSIWDWETEKNSHYIKILPKELQENIKKYGRRNITLNTCAPAGSISILTKTTSGIEPIFKREYTRNRKLTKDEIDRGVKSSYIDDKGVPWISTNINHPGLTEWKKTHPTKDIKNSPYYNCEAAEIKWDKRVKIQSIAQKYIDSSISSTVNLPENVTIDEVNKIYLTAWELGCKGITIYRENSRLGVLVDKNKKELTEIIEHDAPSRPQILPCDIHYATVGKESWVLFVGLLNGKPYDIFGGSKSNIEIPKKFKKGWIKKNGIVNGTRTYDLILGTLEESEERMVIKDISNVFNCNMGSYTRIISTMLRHGIKISFICEQLYKDNASDMFTFEKSIARTLKKYIKDGELANGICEKCGSNNMIYNSGCATCSSCGYSKCQ